MDLIDTESVDNEDIEVQEEVVYEDLEPTLDHIDNFTSVEVEEIVENEVIVEENVISNYEDSILQDQEVCNQDMTVEEAIVDIDEKDTESYSQDFDEEDVSSNLKLSTDSHDDSGNLTFEKSDLDVEEDDDVEVGKKFENSIDDDDVEVGKKFENSIDDDDVEVGKKFENSIDDDDVNNVNEESIINEEMVSDHNLSDDKTLDVEDKPIQLNEVDDDDVKAKQSSETKVEGEDIAQDIADIFGDSDEDEEFTGFDSERKAEEKKLKRKLLVYDSDGEEPAAQQSDEEKTKNASEGNKEESEDEEPAVCDFDIIMQKKKAEKKSRRRRDGGTTISDADDIVNNMLKEMKEAADDDREAAKKSQPALHKLKMLTRIISHINKQDLKESFIEMGVYSAIADWLTPIHEYSLPHLSIRRGLLKVLHSLPPASSETLSSSKVGRAVMYLFKHPDEIRANKELAGRLISKWSRPLFGLNENFKSMSRSEREQRDLEQMPQSKKRKVTKATSSIIPGDSEAETSDHLRPGDKGFVMRARVPMPSHKDYLIRPKWKVGSGSNEDMSQFRRKKVKPKKNSRLDKHLKNFAEQKKRQKSQRAVSISLQGNKMKLS